MAPHMKVLFVTTESIPYAKTGGLADVAGSLPRELLSLGCDVRVIMPLYKCTKNKFTDIKKHVNGVKHFLIKDNKGFDVYTDIYQGVRFYFVQNDKHFERDELYGTSLGDYSDNALRFSFFSKAVLAAISALDFIPDIVHCNDWQTALIPFYLKVNLSGDGLFKDVKTLFTVHNFAYQGIFPKKAINDLDIPERFFTPDSLEFNNKLNLMKSGIIYADSLNTVSSKYAKEMTEAHKGCGLDGLVKTRKDDFYGILNGVDYSVWSPQSDKNIKTNYTFETIEKKSECKKDLITYTGLEINVDKPLIGCVSRFVEQKGIDLLADIMSDLVFLGAGVVMLGNGDAHYNNLFASIAKKYPKNVYVCNDFNDELAHKIEAGSDIFVMPSRYEPCGLNQMYSIKYGTIPVVRATGGLDDVIVDYEDNIDDANGFKFGPPTKEAFLKAIKRAFKVYKDKPAWKKLMQRAMEYDFSWNKSAKQYLELYRKLL